ncbi:MAG: HAD hydrolase-like protein [Eubacterium sp.]|nr:HAD hydrolase-like protein [Eubacterium sp.]
MRKHILFDLDGTLTDPMVGITSSVQYALSRFGIEVKYLKELIPFIGPPLTESFEKYYGLSHDQALRAVDYYREYFSPTGIYENEIYPGVREMLERLSDAGYQLYLASSKPTVYVERILKYFDIEGFFDYVGGSELDGTRVQKQDVVAHVLWKCGIPAADAIMVGDRRHDVEGARACGVLSVGVLFGYGSEDELKKAGASHIVASVKELETFLLEQDEVKEDQSVIRFGIIGTDRCGEDFFRANRFSHGFELTAVYDPDMEQAKAFGFRKGPLEFFDQLDEFANYEQLDAVFVSGPPENRYEQIRTMLQAGRHVLAEMPLALKEQDAKELFALAEEKEVILMEAVFPVYAPSFEKMIQYLGSLGEVRQAVFQLCRHLPEHDRKRAALFSTAILPVSCMIRLFGEPDRVTGAGVLLEDEIDGAGTILMEYKDLTGTVIYSQMADAAVPSQIQGEDASMLIREIDSIKDLRIFRRTVDQTVHFEQSDNIMQYGTREFMKIVRTGLGWEEARDRTLAALRVLEQAGRQIM